MKYLTFGLSGSFVLATLLACSAAQSNETKEIRGDRDWLGRKWEFTYVMLVDSPDGMAYEAAIGKKNLSLGEPNRRKLPAAIFPYNTLLVSDSVKESERNRSISTLLITFDNKGLVTSPYEWEPGLTGHINRLLEVSLAVGNGPNELIFNIGDWYTGVSTSELNYIPAICSYDDTEKRYKRGFKADSFDSFGTFGCREWGYYLKSDAHPYIDVTSYYQDGGTYIRPFIGWGRFDVPAKPVIGKQGKAWMCLYDCPNGAAPGVIPDIAAWAKQQGWQVPKRPKKMPIFTDVPRKRGEFVD
jgi:hypothetical protein